MIVFEKLRCFFDAYTELWILRDKRVDGLLLMDSPYLVLVIVCLYLTMTYVGPKWIRDRKPFKLKFFMFFYNVSIAIFNLFIFIELTTFTLRRHYSIICEPVRLSTDHEEMTIVKAFHLYLLSKVIELLDTMFIILKKKRTQLSFLHVYHHSSILLLTWAVVRWSPGGSAAYAACVNSFVHVVMYSYYSISVFGPSMVKYLWWKRYITVIQLLQFVVGVGFIINMTFSGCEFAIWLQHIGAVYLSFYIFLFGRFFRRTYVKRKENIESANDRLT